VTKMWLDYLVHLRFSSRGLDGVKIRMERENEIIYSFNDRLPFFGWGLGKFRFDQ
jgi:hypothetical protein